jgi:hydroxyacylglutathione hydrolase
VLIRQFAVPGLGHLSTLITDERWGVAAVVDPRRDVDEYLAAAVGDGVRVTHVVETHLHNDYVSGGRELAAIAGAEHAIGAGAGLAFEHRPVRHDEGFLVGDLLFTALETPGHTPEHVAYAVADTSRAQEPWLLFTGGSLLVGSVGRTDLLGAEHGDAYARDQFHSLHDVILRNEDFVGVYPTHGAGSLCSANISSTPATTIGFERRFNPYLQPADAETFARILLRDQPAFPRYFVHMRGINQAGPRPIGLLPEPNPIEPARIAELAEAGAAIVDVRPAVRHAAGHVPGSVSIPAGGSFSTWLGWVVEFGRRLVFVLDDTAEWDEVVRSALRIGFDGIDGYLSGGLEAWAAAGLPVDRTEALSAAELGRRLDSAPAETFLIDVRQSSEFDDAHVPGSVHIMAGTLRDRLAELPRDRPIATICASGYRSAIAASLLRAAGFTDVAWVSDGVPAWKAAGRPVAHGSQP